MKTKLTIIMAGLMSLSFPLQAQTALTTEHVDIGLAEGAGLGLHWHDETNGIEYEPDEAFAFFDPVAALNSRPAGAQWDFLGMAAGQNVWILPQSSDPSLPFLGVGAEDADPFTFDIWNPLDPRGGADVNGRWIGLELTSFSGPGHFSVWQTDAGVPTAFMSTASALVGGNRLFVQEVSHSHYNWGFSELGVYEIGFTAYSYIGGNLVQNNATFVFSSVNPIPEPSTYALMAFGGLMAGAMWMRARRRKAQAVTAQ
ncbi:choice-of-anchor M domain-containing protein [Kamptonema cortianum]|nr:choice-of-anchor M domain-containing protein [Kamptonema cortianum]MDL5044511.1 choice-of-anchor M domain-containing protein [Oscillatoria amoena NRMC-F 0135]